LLKPGMTANVQFMVNRKEGVLKVPNSALRFRPPEDKPQPQAPAEGQEERPAAGRGGGAREGERGGNRGGQAQRGGGRSREGTVYVLRGQKATPVRIRLGINDGTSSEVAAGDVKEGEQVVVAMSSAGQARASGPARRPFGF
jgi:HlyD family secretion protein